MNKLISVEKALELIKTSAEILENTEVVSVNESLGRTLAEDILAPISLPPFRQSIMDGYALSLTADLIYNVIGETKTGDSSTFTLKKGEAIRIFTGALLPDSANAVVMQEHVEVNGNKITLEKIIVAETNIRRIGDQIEKGEVSLIKGEKINPSSIGLLKSFGINEVQVFIKPKISIISTGNELVESGLTLEPGQIFESNSNAIVAALKQKGFETDYSVRVKDSLEATEIAISNALQYSDLVLISGGISVGDYDFVEKALENNGVKQIFYKILQKPGKPLFFGKKGNKYIFALPGNPASTLTCLYIYVFALIDHITGNKTVGLPRIQFPLSEDFENPFGKALFLKAKLKDSEVEILNKQNSAMVLSFARADSLVYIPADCKMVKKGNFVTTILLPF